MQKTTQIAGSSVTHLTWRPIPASPSSVSIAIWSREEGKHGDKLGERKTANKKEAEKNRFRMNLSQQKNVLVAADISEGIRNPASQHPVRRRWCAPSFQLQPPAHVQSVTLWLNCENAPLRQSPRSNQELKNDLASYPVIVKNQVRACFHNFLF